MPKNNVKILTKEELDFLNEKYIMIYSNDLVLVKTNNYGRVIAHDSKKNFQINSGIKHMVFSKEAIQIWKDNFLDMYTLVDIQDAMNRLIVTYQDITIDNIKKVLQKRF